MQSDAREQFERAAAGRRRSVHGWLDSGTSTVAPGERPAKIS